MIQKQAVIERLCLCAHTIHDLFVEPISTVTELYIMQIRHRRYTHFLYPISRIQLYEYLIKTYIIVQQPN